VNNSQKHRKKKVTIDIKANVFEDLRSSPENQYKTVCPGIKQRASTLSSHESIENVKRNKGRMQNRKM
jgi:hypothetical protein